MPSADVASTQLAALRPGVPFGLPSLRRNVCPHFFMTGPRGPIPVQTPHPAGGETVHAHLGPVEQAAGVLESVLK